MYCGEGESAARVKTQAYGVFSWAKTVLPAAVEEIKKSAPERGTLSCFLGYPEGQAAFGLYA